ncbi:hypothetical protein ANO11243_070940 [Dothideomycetidae sp. 11243]|nr:hypothetical protein ANO11243_070940 [fungal sp. No.11243]
MDTLQTQPPPHTKYGQITPPNDAWDLDWPPEQDPIAFLTSQINNPRRESNESSSSGKSANGRVDKRDKYREKNRVAAAKCRAKKKEHIDGLEDNHRTQSMLNALLKQTEQNLRDELSFWRTQALQHGFCECHAIQDYNLRKARAIAVDRDFGNVDDMRRDSMACTSPSTQLDATMYSGLDDFDSPDS